MYAYKEEPFEMPVGIDASAMSFDRAVARDVGHFVGCESFGDGRPMVTFYPEKSKPTSVKRFSDGTWHERVKVGE